MTYKQEICSDCRHVQGYHDALVGKCFAPGTEAPGKGDDVEHRYCPCQKFARKQIALADHREGGL